MRQSIKAVLILTFFVFCASADARAERRLAFVVGINDYVHIPKLNKAVGDALAMSTLLADLGFQVTPVINPTRRSFNIALGEFAAKLREDDLVFVHFSGHGVEIEGDNILLPADVPKPKAGQELTVKHEGIGLRRLINQISKAGARARVFVVDACRDNPFEQSGMRTVGASRGLTRIEAPSGTFILYSAGYRQTALDSLTTEDTEPTSVYTRVLLDKLAIPGKQLAHIAREVRNEVETLAQSVGHEQRPAYYDELSSKLVLSTKAVSAPKPLLAVAPSQGLSDAAAIELTYWNSVKESGNAELLQSYVDKYPQGQFVFIAKVRISELQAGAAPKAITPVPIRTQTAALQPDASEEVAEETEPNARDAPGISQRELALRVQNQLLRLGCGLGRADGVWGRKSRRALQAFARHGNLPLDSFDPTLSVLDTLQSHTERVCPLRCGRGQVLRGGSCVARTCSGGKVLSRSGRCVNSPKLNRRAAPKIRKRASKPNRVAVKKRRTDSSGRCPAGQRYVYISGYCTTKPRRQWE